jgi:tetratricopeptide (TPR) repeat protein
MRELVATEFLFEQPPLTFVFKHALTHDVAYGCLAEADRGRLHAAAARALERLHADRTDVVLDELANHWSQTGDHRRAIHYLRRLGARAVASSAPSEALAALEPALHKAEQLPEGAERERTVLSIVTEFTMPFVLLGRIDEVKKLLLGYQPRVERLDDLALVGRFFASIALPHDHIGEYREAEAFAGRALEAATRVGDEATMSMALTVLTLASLWGGRFTEGIERADRAVPLGGPDVAMWRGLSLWVKAHEEILLGRLEGGVRCSEALWQVGTASENRHLQSYARCAAGWIANLKGDSQTALELCEKAVELAASPFTRAVVVAYLGEALDAAGRHGDAREQLVSSVEFCRRFNFPQLVAWNLARLSVAELGTGDRRHARVLAEDALSVARAVEFPYAEALALRACGLVAHAERAFASAVEHLAAALATLVQIDCRYHAAIVRLDLATALAETGARDEARQHLDRSAGEFRALAIPVWETRTATLARRLGLAPANESADDA